MSGVAGEEDAPRAVVGRLPGRVAEAGKPGWVRQDGRRRVGGDRSTDGYALGAAVAGLVANASGLSAAIADEGMVRAAFWVPASFVVPAILAILMGLRIPHLRKP